MDLIGVTDLRQNAKAIIDSLTDKPVTVLSRSKPVAVLIHPATWERLLDRLDELEVIADLQTAPAGTTTPWSEAREQIAAAAATDDPDAYIDALDQAGPSVEELEDRIRADAKRTGAKKLTDIQRPPTKRANKKARAR